MTMQLKGSYPSYKVGSSAEEATEQLDDLNAEGVYSHVNTAQGEQLEGECCSSCGGKQQCLKLTHLT